MTIAYIFLITAACILIAMAIESILRSMNALNAAAAFLLFTAAVLIGSMGLTDYFALLNYQSLSFLMTKIQTAALYFIGYAFFAFSIQFPKDKKAEGLRFINWVLLVFSAAFALISLTGQDINRYNFLIYTQDVTKKLFELYIEHNFFYYIGLTVSIAAAAVSILLIVIKYHNTHLIYQKKQIRYFLSGLAFLVLVQTLLFLIRDSLLPFISYFLSSLSFVAAGGMLMYSVITYRFVNLRRNLVSLIRDFIIGIIVALPIIFLIFIFRSWLDRTPMLLFFVIMVPGIVFFFWIYQLAGNLIRKILQIDYLNKDMTEIFLDKIGKSYTISELARNTVEALTDHINCRNADFLIFDGGKEIFKVLYSSNGRDYNISAIEPFFRHISGKIDVYDRELINFDPRFSGIKDSAERYFKKHEAALFVPFFYENELIALLPISGKLDNTSYISRELALITKLKKISQIILHNIILFDKEEEAKLTKRDLLLASNIQESIFQSTIPTFSHIDIYAYQKPAKGVSGDYFLIEKVSNESLGVLIADVSGKGFSAALVSMVIHTITKSQEFSSTSTNAIVSKINEVMTSSQNYSRLTKTMSFATVFCGFFDNALRTLFYTNAGHHPIIVYDTASGDFEFIKANAKPVGIFQEESYLSRIFHYKKGKIFVLYSDGITETINSKEEEFGVEKLQALIRQYELKTSREIADEIISAVENFSDSAEPFDDMTLIVIKL